MARSKADLEMQRVGTWVEDNEVWHSRVTAQNMYCRDIMQQAAAARPDRTFTMEDNADCVRRHNAEFKALPPERKAFFRPAADEESRLRDSRHLSVLEQTRTRLAIMKLRKALSRDADLGVPNTLSALRFADQDLEELAAQVSNSEHQGDAISETWRELTSDPSPPPLALQDELLRLEATMEAEAPAPPDPWRARRVLQHRDRFLGTALAFAEDPEEAFWFCCAKFTTTTIAFLKLSRVEHVIPALGARVCPMRALMAEFGCSR